MTEETTTEALHKIQVLMERFDARLDSMDSRLDSISSKTDALHMLVAGNGSSQSIIMRLTLAEARLADMDRHSAERDAAMATELEDACAEIETLRTTQEAWRNRAIGIGSAMSVAGGVVALVGAKILQVFNSP
jgi:hypothetical protein